MRFSGNAVQDTAVRYSSQVQDTMISILLDNLTVQLGAEDKDRTAGEIVAFTIPVTLEEGDPGADMVVEIGGHIALEAGLRASLCISIGDGAALVDLPMGLLGEPPSVAPGPHEPVDGEVGGEHFERTLSMRVSGAVEDVLVTIVLLLERTQKASGGKAAFGQLWVDQLHLVLPAATASQPM